MRVAILAHSAPRHDAVGNQVLEKVLFFQERGADVRVFLHTSRNLHPLLTRFSIEEQQVQPSGLTWDFLLGCDLVLGEYSLYFPLLDYFSMLAREKPRLVFDYYGVTPPDFAEGPLRQTLEESCAQRGLAWFADAVLTHSRFSAEELIQATSYPSDRITQIDLPIDEAFGPGEVRRSPFPFQSEKRQVLLFVGRMAANKRPHLLVQALHLLRDRRPELRAVYIGERGDQYARSVEECRSLAREWGVEDRIHFLGQLPLADLVNAYRAADLLVLPSVHEGFCVPVREAMACGLPVLASRAAALPETVGNAGLTFKADDPLDLTAQIQRILDGAGLASHQQKKEPKLSRIALACFRFGKEVIGGAERSLKTIGLAFQAMGCAVEVFTTCNHSEADWKNELKAGTTREEGLVIHRFPIDPHDRPSHLLSLQRLRAQSGAVPDEMAAAYLRHSIHSTALLQALEARSFQFDALVAGPYLFGLTSDIARRFPDKTLLLPCFHDEPLAHLPLWPDLYCRVGGILYHSPEEQAFAQARLSINHPNSDVIGTWLPPSPLGEEKTSQEGRPYVVYCGRYSSEKDLPRLLEYAARYQEDRRGQLDFVFLGQGEVKIPDVKWAKNLGPVDERRKAEVLRGALGLVQLSRQESLSLVALEAWREGAPVLVDAGCTVLHGMVQRSEGGMGIRDYGTFAEALDWLSHQPERAKDMGRKGQSWVKTHFQDAEAFARVLWERVEALPIPLDQQMRHQGLIRTRQSERSAWREAFGQWVDQVLHMPPSSRRMDLRLQVDETAIEGVLGEKSVLLPVTLQNKGDLPAADRGPGRTCLCAVTVDAVTGTALTPIHRIDLPGPVLPGQCVSAAVSLPLPTKAGKFVAYAWADLEEKMAFPAAGMVRLELRVRNRLSHDGGALRGQPDSDARTDGRTAQQVAQQALVAALALQRLPDDYVDVTEGWFARLKRWIKGKLLGNFRRAYVDVLSRQQSRVNQHLIQALTQLGRSCATLDHALRTLQRRVEELEGRLDGAPLPGPAQEEPGRIPHSS